MDGLCQRTLPVLLAQGTNDGLVRPEVTFDYMSRLCGAGNGVRLLVLPGVSHGLAGAKSADDAVAWIKDGFAGRPAPSDCKGRKSLEFKPKVGISTCVEFIAAPWRALRSRRNLPRKLDADSGNAERNTRYAKALESGHSPA